MSASRRPVLRLATPLLTLACFAVAGRAAPGDSVPTTIHLSRVEFTGLARHTPEQVLAAAGLRRGQTITDVELKDLSNRLLRTGLFKKVSNRYLITGLDMDITFTVEESDWNVPVLFDNIVWFSDAELTAAVSARVPTFEGRAPETGGVLLRIAEVLQGLLADRRLPGRVVTRPSFGSAGIAMKHVFVVEGVEIEMCRFSFPGSHPGRELELVRRAKAIVGKNFSRSQIERFAELTLLSVYLEEGRLGTTFGEPLVRLEADIECAGGVSIALPVTEGEVHAWDGARWSGNNALTTEELDSLLGMKRGEPAASDKIRAGLDAVREAYRSKGYMALELTEAPEVAADAPRALWRISIEEGPRYSMGSFVISGLPEDLVELARREWRLAGGTPFDASYPGRFTKEVLLKAKYLKPGDSLSTSEKIDSERRLVDVTIRVIRAQPDRR